MAGAGVRVFQPGEVLTAALVNTYLQDQVICRFDDATDRDASFGGEDQPLLEEGRVCYLDSTNELSYYDGTAWVPINAEAVINIIEAKGDLVVGTGSSSIDNLSAGANGTILFADATTATGLKWQTIPTDYITTSMIADGSITAAKIADGTVVEAEIADSAVTTGKLADSAVTSAKIADGTIVNADINASAAIAHSKLANITAGSVLLGNASNVPTATALSGDVTVNSSGVTAIASGVIVNADVSNSAAIAYSKLNLSGSITSADIVDGTIVNGDISSTAAIDQGKIADTTIDTKTSNYTLVLGDKNKIVEMNLAGANTVSVPTNASVAFPVGSQITITQYGAGKTQVVAVTPATTTIRSTPGVYLRAQYSSATLIKRATDEWYLVGDLSAT